MRSGALIKSNNLPVQMYSVIVAILPLLATYASGIPGLTVADVALAVCVVMTLVGGYSKQNRFVLRPTLIVLALYMIVLFGLVTVTTQEEPEIGNIVVRVIRYFFYLAVIAISSVRMLDLRICKQMVRLVAILGTVYILLQYLLYYLFGYVLRGFLPFLDLYVEGYAVQDYGKVYSTMMYRPTSFFLEPAHFARYAVIGLALYLFDDRHISLKQILGATFVSGGILLSTSAQGYLLMAVVWGGFLVHRIRDIRVRWVRNAFYLLIPFLPLLLMMILQIPFVQTAVERALNIDIASENTALGARTGGFLFFFELPPLYKLIGMGFGVVPEGVWVSSAVYWLYGAGIFVFLLYCLYGLRCLLRVGGSARYILLVFLLLFITDDSFYSYMCVLFVSLSLLKPVEVDG